MLSNNSKDAILKGLFVLEAAECGRTVHIVSDLFFVHFLVTDKACEAKPVST